jgi:hypothetical protein
MIVGVSVFSFFAACPENVSNNFVSASEVKLECLHPSGLYRSFEPARVTRWVKPARYYGQESKGN